jgi:catechol 2,3-dioxygenase-like lactoylglutathione lyase family enzyme
MLDHVIVTMSDFTRSIAFYAQALKPLGITDFLDYKGQDGHPDLFEQCRATVSPLRLPFGLPLCPD